MLLKILTSIVNNIKRTSLITFSSYSLIYSIFIATIIFLVCSSIILLSYFNRLQIEKYIKKETLRTNSLSGINLMLADKTIVGINQSKSIALYEQEDEDIVELIKKQWGAFEIYYSISEWKNMRFSKIALCGDDVFTGEKVSLYLTDQNKPFSLCGSTSIKGICYIPKAGVKRAYIEGKSFIGKELINGEIKNSSTNLPQIKNLQNLNFAYFKTTYLKNDSLTTLFDDIQIRQWGNSFNNEPRILYSTNGINLDYMDLKGNIIVISEKYIEVSMNNSLDNIIVVAPYINISSRFTGNIQAFATDSINVEENCNLQYPSILGIVNDKADEYSPTISIGEYSEINGVVYIYKKTIQRKNVPFIKISKEAIIKGIAYCNGMIELKGEVWGSVYCDKFILSTRSSVYENHLLDATIDFSRLSKHYVGINVLDDAANKKVIRWLN